GPAQSFGGAGPQRDRRVRAVFAAGEFSFREGKSGIAVEQVAPVERLDVWMLDRLDVIEQAGLEAGLVLRGREGSGLPLMQPEGFEQARGLGQQVLERAAPLRTEQVVRVHAGGQRDELERMARTKHRKSPHGSARGGSSAGRI